MVGNNMPRVYTSASDPIDFCRLCYPSEAKAQVKYANVGDGPDDRGNCFAHYADHPPYDGEDYTCETCGRKLIVLDD